MCDNRNLHIDHVSKSYGDHVVLEDIQLQFQENGVVGLLGRNGAGKTTLLRVAAGLLFPDKGRVTMGMDDAGSLNYKSRVAYLSERNAIYPHLKVIEYLKWVGQVYRSEKVKPAVAEASEKLDLSGILDRRIGELSKGMKQRVGLAACLVPNPEVLLLDEPVNGLDPAQIIHLRSVIKELGKEKIVILSSHLLQEISAVSDRIVLIDHKKIIVDGPLQEILSRKSNQRIELTLNKKGLTNHLRSVQWVKDVREKSNNVYTVTSADHTDIRELLFDLAVKKGWKILGLKVLDHPLDDLFKTS